VEGSLRGLGRPMTQQEMVKAVRQELRKSISQSYLSQIENGARPHMTQSSRALLAKFFKVHPGFLVDDPEGYHTELTSDLRTTEGQLDVWLLQGSERFVSDPEVSEVLIKAAREKDTRRCAVVVGCDSGHAGVGRSFAGRSAAGIGCERKSREAVTVTTSITVIFATVARLQKGGESDESFMTWADFYLVCFAVGFCFSFFSFVLGSPHRPFASSAWSCARRRGRFACSVVTRRRDRETESARKGRARGRAADVSPLNSSPWRHSWPGLAGWAIC
jgi:transcriptional regulator with XRE-family HTH domain